MHSVAEAHERRTRGTDAAAGHSSRCALRDARGRMLAEDHRGRAQSLPALRQLRDGWLRGARGGAARRRSSGDGCHDRRRRSAAHGTRSRRSATPRAHLDRRADAAGRRCRRDRGGRRRLDGDRVSAAGIAGQATTSGAPARTSRRARLAIPAGVRIGPAELGMLAALGVIDVPVFRAPRVAIIATGDELVDAATLPGPGQLVDSSAHAVTALIGDAGGIPVSFGFARDDPMTLAALIASASDHDVSDHDRRRVRSAIATHVRAALASAGRARSSSYKVAMKPGKPFSFGMNGHVPVFGLPGNPVSTFVIDVRAVRSPRAARAAGRRRSPQRPRAPVVLRARLSQGRPLACALHLRAHVVRQRASTSSRTRTRSKVARCCRR